LGCHHEFTDLNRALRRKYQEGIADVMLGQAHPELRPTLLLARLRRYALLPSRILALLAFKWPATGDHVVAILQRSLAFLEKWKMRHLWQRILDGLLGYWYWKGVARELKTFKQTDAFLKPALPYAQRNESLMKLDLSQGLDEAERLLDAHRPAGAQIYYRTQHIGLIPPTPGAERLRGIHLRPCLATALMAPLLRALTLEGGFISTDMNEKVIAACDEKIKYQKLNESRYA
jgi:hypothetical protein